MNLSERNMLNMIVLDMSDKRPIYEQIVSRFKELISIGVLNTDEQMPSVRSLAIELSINPNTIQRAYIELEREGYIYSVKGRGNYVSDINKMLPKRQKQYFEEVEVLLNKLASYSLSKADLIEYIEKYELEGDVK